MDYIGSGYYAEKFIVFIHNRQSCDVIFGHQIYGVQQSGVWSHHFDVFGHYIFNRFSAVVFKVLVEVVNIIQINNTAQKMYSAWRFERCKMPYQVAFRDYSDDLFFSIHYRDAKYSIPVH